MNILYILFTIVVLLLSFYTGHGYRLDRINLRTEKEIISRIAKLQRELENLIKSGAAAGEIESKKAVIESLKWVIINQNHK